jgi:hypothetical protein
MSDVVQERDLSKTGGDDEDLDFARFVAEMDRLEESIQKSLANTRAARVGVAADQARIQEGLARLKATG